MFYNILLHDRYCPDVCVMSLMYDSAINPLHQPFHLKIKAFPLQDHSRLLLINQVLHERDIFLDFRTH